MKENTTVLHAQVPVNVATYLLNEKRSEIHAIEARLKVSIILIPNVYLETPNYSVTRLRHDDVKGEAPTSYHLVEKPLQEISLPVSVQENKPARPQAAVRGITPSQPAPVREQLAQQPVVQPSLLDRIFNWFKQGPRPEQSVQPAPTSPGTQRVERMHGRRDRGREAYAGEHEKTPRPVSRTRDSGQAIGTAGTSNQPSETAPQRPERGDSKSQGERAAQKRHPRPPREEKMRPAAKSSPDEQTVSEELAQPAQAEEGGRRRRRGGRNRDRGERTPREVREASTKEAHAGQQAADQEVRDEKPLPMPEVPAAAVVEASALVLGSSAFEAHNLPQSREEPPAEPLLVLPPLNSASVSESEAAEEPATESVNPTSPDRDMEIEPIQAEAAQERSLESSPAPVATFPEPEEVERGAETVPVEANPAAEATVSMTDQKESLAAPRHEPEPLDLSENGLVMIETLPEKLKPALNDEEAETALPPRRRRQTPPAAQDQQEPLVQVETQK